jgi:hypothetical protein
MASFLAAGMQHAGSYVALTLLGWMRGGSSRAFRLARTRATNHEAAHAETEAVAEDERPLLHACARAV